MATKETTRTTSEEEKTTQQREMMTIGNICFIHSSNIRKIRHEDINETSQKKTYQF